MCNALESSFEWSQHSLPTAKCGVTREQCSLHLVLYYLVLNLSVALSKVSNHTDVRKTDWVLTEHVYAMLYLQCLKTTDDADGNRAI